MEAGTATGIATECVRPRRWADDRGRRALATCENSTSANAHGRRLVAGGHGVAGSNPVSPTEKPQLRGGSSGVGRPLLCALWARTRGGGTRGLSPHNQQQGSGQPGGGCWFV